MKVQHLGDHRSFCGETVPSEVPPSSLVHAETRTKPFRSGSNARCQQL